MGILYKIRINTIFGQSKKDYYCIFSTVLTIIF